MLMGVVGLYNVYFTMSNFGLDYELPSRFSYDLCPVIVKNNMMVITSQTSDWDEGSAEFGNQEGIWE